MGIALDVLLDLDAKKVGICDIHMTTGKKEHKAFAQAQDYLKATKQEHMRCVEGDLSGKKQSHVHLWLKTGEGDGVISAIRVQKTPMANPNSALTKVPFDYQVCTAV